MASKTGSLSVEGVGGKTRDEERERDGGGAGSKVSSPASKHADRGDGDGGGAASGVMESKSSESDAVQEGKTSPSRDGAAGTGSTPADRSSSDAAGPIVVEAGGRQSGPNLVQRFVDFVFRVIHTEMDSFFTEHANKFDQDWEDFNQQGETLEQFQVSAVSEFILWPLAM